MRRFANSRPLLTLCVLLVLVSSGRGVGALAAEPAPPPPSLKAIAPADFKLAIAFYGLRKEPITTSELIVHGGTAYHFACESPAEIVIINPNDRRVELLDLERRVQAEISFVKLDEKQTTLHRAIAGAIRKQEEAGGRSNRLSAEMSRALNDPDLTETFDPASSRLVLTNPAVTAEATGAPDPDMSRLALIVTALDALIKLTAVRDPETIPPFIRLDTVHALIVGHQLRPTELAFTYRLAGPPRKHRWTYRLVDTLTTRELEALNRVGRIRSNTKFIPFDRYERTAESKAKTKEN
jgi:hypothetical protein